jgi:3-oxoacyl-[acyl-carrier protein] reductase
MAKKPLKPMYVDLTDTVALVTGAGTGIGRALAIGLARCGSQVVVSYSKSVKEAEGTVATIEEAGGNAVALQADVTSEEQVANLVEKTCSHFGHLDIVVANAGSPIETQPTSKLSASDWEAGLALNCSSAFYCVKHASPRLPDRSGRIILTSSMSARTGAGPGMVTYAAAKGAINNMVRNWAKEFAPRGITVNALAPGIVWSRIHERHTAPEDYRKLIERIPLGYDGKPEDMVGAVLLLASQDGRYITGQILEVNGGILMP